MATSQINVQPQLRKLRQVSSTIQTYKSNMSTIQGTIDSNWSAKEMKSVDKALLLIQTKLAKLSSELDSLESDISAAANEVNKELATAAAQQPK